VINNISAHSYSFIHSIRSGHHKLQG